MSILIDDRAGSRQLIDLRPLNQIGMLGRLESGDVFFMGNGNPEHRIDIAVGVEVKSIFDLISSIATGRLQATQLTGMIRDYDVCWLLYYGNYRPNPADGTLQIRKGKGWVNYAIGKRLVPYGYVESFLLDVTDAGVHVKKVFDVAEAAEWIGVLWRKWQKPWSERGKRLRGFDNSQAIALPDVDPKTELRARVAAQLPGIGYIRGLQVANAFPSVRAMVNADERAWADVPGVGKVLAHAAVTSVK